MNRYPVNYQQNDIVFNNKTIREAVLLWYSDQEKCIEQYGHISYWNTSGVTDMSNLFYILDKDIYLEYAIRKIKFGLNSPNIYKEDILRKYIDLLNSERDQEKIKKIESLIKSFDFIKKTNNALVRFPVMNKNDFFKNFEPAQLKVIENQDVIISDIEKYENEYFIRVINEAPSFNEDLSRWNTSNVIDMSRMFCMQINCNPNLSRWNTSKVKNMKYMFYFALNFNSDISQWKTYNVKDMTNMFFGAINFNSDISQWNTSKVQNMFQMFYRAINFNSDISQWDTSKVENMTKMFYHATNFNSNISNWDTSELTNSQYMFAHATNFNQDLSNWDTSEIKVMNNMFQNATSFNNNNKPLKFVVDKKAETENVFLNSPLQEQSQNILIKVNILNRGDLLKNLRRWSESEDNLRRRENLIQEIGDISDWNISRTRDLSNLFMNNTEFNEDISRWNTYKVTDMSNTFYSATKFNQDISQWDTSKVEKMGYIFAFSGFNQNISQWDISNVEDKDIMLMFAYNLDYQNVIFDNYELNQSSMFFNPNIYLNNKTIREAIKLWTKNENVAIQKYGNIENWRTDLVTDMSYLFYNFKQVPKIENWNVKSVINMDYMFYNLEDSQVNSNRLILIFGIWDLFSLKYAFNMINDNFNLEFNDSIDNLVTEISKTGMKNVGRDRIYRNRIFNDDFNNQETTYKMYDYNESKKDDIEYFYQNLAKNIEHHNIRNSNFINNLNNRGIIKTRFKNNIGEENFSDTADVGGITKLLLFEPFVRFLYYDSRIIDATITCQKTKLENDKKTDLCPFILENDQLKINPNLKEDQIDNIFGSVDLFYELIGVILRKIINTPLRSIRNDGRISNYEYFNTYIPFGKVLASLITGEIRIDNNRSFMETNNIFNLINQIEDIEKELKNINDQINSENLDIAEENFTNESIDLFDVNLEHKLPFLEIHNLYNRNLAIRQKLHWLKYGFNNPPDVDFTQEYLGENEKKLVIASYLCSSKPQLFNRFESFYNSMIKINEQETRFFDYYKGEIKVDDFEQRLNAYLHGEDVSDEPEPTVITTGLRITSRRLISEFTCHINDERQKFLQIIDTEIRNPSLSEIFRDRLMMFKELVENVLDNETLIRLFIWFSGNRCCPDFAKISLVDPTYYTDNNVKKYLFSAATCFNELRIPTYDYSQGFNIFIDSNNQIRGPKKKFFTTKKLRRNYVKSKLYEILLFSMRFS